LSLTGQTPVVEVSARGTAGASTPSSEPQFVEPATSGDGDVFFPPKVEQSAPEPAKARARARTKIGRSVQRNQVQILLSVEMLSRIVDDEVARLKLEASRKNSFEARSAVQDSIDRYVHFKRQLKAVSKATREFASEKTSEGAVQDQIANKFQRWIYDWLDREHVNILNKSTDLVLFSGAMLVCTLAGTADH
jgi:intergrase/recombinase